MRNQQLVRILLSAMALMFCAGFVAAQDPLPPNLATVTNPGLATPAGKTAAPVVAAPTNLLILEGVPLELKQEMDAQKLTSHYRHTARYVVYYLPEANLNAKEWAPLLVEAKLVAKTDDLTGIKAVTVFSYDGKAFNSAIFVISEKTGADKIFRVNLRGKTDAVFDKNASDLFTETIQAAIIHRGVTSGNATVKTDPPKTK